MEEEGRMKSREQATSLYRLAPPQTASIPHELIPLLPANWPTEIPLARITTCGKEVSIAVLQRIEPASDAHPTLIYGPPDAALLAEKGASTSLILLCVLASQPGCSATKDWLSETLGHLHASEEEDEDDDLDERPGLKRVDNVVTHLRHLLFPPILRDQPRANQLRRQLVRAYRATSESGPGYRLAGLPLLWVDVEAISEHIQQARALDQFGHDGLPAWQVAYDLAGQGIFLEQEPYSDWASWRRQRVETQLWECVQALWRRVGKQGEAGETEALRILQSYWQSHITNEDALRPLIELLGKRECYGQAEEYYAHLCLALEQEGKQPDQRTQETMTFLRALRIQRKPPQYQSILTTGKTEHKAFLSAASVDPQIREATSSTDSHLLEFSEASVTNLATITHQFRVMQRRGDTFISNGVNTHIQTVQAALEQTVDDSIRRELWRVLAQTQIVAGFNPIKKTEQGRAKTFLETAVASAQNSDDKLLIAAAIGHLAHFTFRQEQNITKALQLLNRAQEYVQASHPLNGWLMLVFASIAAKTEHKHQCESYLTNAMKTAQNLPKRSELADIYFTDFSLISVSVFTINSWLAIGDAEKASTHLTETRLEELSDNRRASALYDAFRVWTMMGEFELAQNFAFQAIEKALLTKQLYVIPRCIQLAQTLRQKAPDKPYASAIADYARFALEENKGEGK